jgi:linoleoyl-CoA desaturase
MSVEVVKFNLKNQPEFFKELQGRVNRYFKEKKISKYANFNMKFKTGFMLCLYFSPLVLMLTGVVSTLWPIIIMWIIMGFGMAGVGLSIMHDANHGSYSRSKKVNTILGNLIHFIGGYKVNWKIQHNVLHHSFTNIDGFDDDIKFAMMRFSPNQKRKSFHRFQMFYAPFFYGFMTMYWLTSKDFQQLIKYNKKNLLASQGTTLTKSIWILILNKIWYLALMLALPIIFIDIAWWQTVIGFLSMHYICGLTLAMVFQSAHVLEDTHFYKADENGSVENNWAIHQMKTTANFAQKSRIFSWYIGALNYQIEHHLFPNICHIHYKRISKIVKETAKEFDVPYYQNSSFLSALKSHFKFLHQLGTGKTATS